MWEPVSQPGSLTDRIVASVEKLLSDESLKPGDRLPSEREMAQLLGVSRPSLREAVRILQARGRLEVKHGQGVFVQAPRSEQELRALLSSEEMNFNELYAMREVLEVPAGGWAAEKATNDQIAELRSILDRMNTILDGGQELDFEELGRLDTEFHMSIAAAAGNRFLRQTSHVLYDILRTGMETTLAIPGRTEIARRDHERIYQGIAAHDPGAARKACRAHIRGAHAAAIKRVEQRASA